ncbi:serine hydrolase domain-containing protein [Mesorhizobium sangaii]|uniref:CubicO group peptidase (Beta-lactamase class C family) n=1 Tax=Mesorhizobium sangaii TaxID=505389 RepID=A0A841PVM1_9HYPH|nr:serine hydrolase [Mesorhizobium sangaii]MBB6414152.1 CubicO group peptidase (beta-lactamase class C family) [Mesorhizobium sangaii]
MTDNRDILKMSIAAAPVPFLPGPGKAQSTVSHMDASHDWLPDPMRPDAPMIPRTGWDLSPYNRWTFQHVREWTPTASIWRGSGPVQPLPQRPTDIDGITFEVEGRRHTIREFLNHSYTDGFLVLHRGEVVAEKYMNGLEPHTPHLAMSVTKCITGTLFGILVGKGLIDPDRLVTQYLPELEATAYRGAKVQHVLDMTAGVKVAGPYTEPYTPGHMFQLAAGWWPLEYAKYPDYPKNTWQAVLRLTEQEAPHGSRFSYRSPENNVLGFIMQRVTGKMIPELFSSELWAPMGAEEDAYITVDRGGFPCTDGGFNATLRDYARFALLHLRGGKLNGKQIVPSEWIEETRTADDHLFQIHGEEPGAYHNCFTIHDPKRRDYSHGGHGGQLIYMDPEADFAVVKLSCQPHQYWQITSWSVRADTKFKQAAEAALSSAAKAELAHTVEAQKMTRPAICAIRDALASS